MPATRKTRSARQPKVYLPDCLPASVDQTDIKPRLPFPLRSSDKRYTRQDMLNATNISPLKKLPRSLIPRAGEAWMPPVLYYGWPLVDTHKAEFVEYGKAHRLLQRDELLYCTDDEDQDPILKDYVDLETLELIAKSKAREIDWPESLVRVGLPLHFGFPRMVAAYTNYDLAKCPSDEDVKRLQWHMKFDMGPQWYVSMEDWNWSNEPQRRRL